MAQDEQLYGSSWRVGPNLLSQLFYNAGAPPDAESFDVSPRRRLYGTGTSVVPLSGSGTANVPIPLQDTLTNKDGLVFDSLNGMVTTADATGHLTIVDCAVVLAPLGFPNVVVPLSTPTPTTLIPRIRTSLLFENPPIYPANDLDQWAVQVSGTSIFTPGQQPLTLNFSVSCANNDAAAAHTFTILFWAAYRFVRGLGGA